MLTLVISDMHLGARPVNDVLRSHLVRAKLMPCLARADQVVLIGDALELRQAPVDQALDVARPFFGELGEVVGNKRVVLVPGNHDHPLLEERPSGQFERPVSAGEGGPLGQLASWLPQTELILSYPGYRIRDDVYATHGHYLDCHNTVPTVENMLIAVAKRRAKLPESGPLTVSDYENTVASVYTLGLKVAQPGAERGGHAQPARLRSLQPGDLRPGTAPGGPASHGRSRRPARDRGRPRDLRPHPPDGTSRRRRGLVESQRDSPA